MKIAIYCICKNESLHIERFMKTAQEADHIYITDTGSSDNTIELLKQYPNVTINTALINPWRFDDARNISLSFVPLDVDVCVCVDLDEVLTPGWRQAIEKVWIPNKTTKLKYKYNWSHLPDGSPGTTFWYEKIHSRTGYRWVKPVHEVLHSYIEECIAMSYEFELDHWPDLNKSRSNYLPLLKLAVDEEPNDDRSAHYYGRELMFNGKYEEAIIELNRHINLDSAVWIPEVANSMRYIARCYFNLGDIKNALYYSQMACIKCPEQREVWLEFAKIAYHNQDYVSAYYASTKCVSIKERELTYISEPEAWSELPWDILSISAYHIGHQTDAETAIKEAIKINPHDSRLQQNALIILQ